jgi:putative ABC transport system permease protein
LASLAFRIARRDLRGSFGSFWILLVGITIGVSAVAGIGSVADAVLAGVRSEARTVVGGDVSLRLFHRPAGPEEHRFLAASGTLSQTAELRPLARRARDGSRPTLVELKGVDATYPLYGTVVLEGGGELAAHLAHRDGLWGAAVDPALLSALDVTVGDRLDLGGVEVEIRALIAAEPDRSLRAFSLGPRVMISLDALRRTGLAASGAQVYWYHRLRLPSGADSALLIDEIESRFPDAGWRIVNADDGVPGVERTVRIAQALLILTGLSVLLIGGVGVANAVSAHLARKTDTIAILKSLGATGRLVFTAYLVQVLAASVPAIAVGLAVGAVAPSLVRPFVADWLPMAEGLAIQPGALASAAGFGLLTALAFSLWPLSRTDLLTPQQLLRETVAHVRVRPGVRILAAMAATIAGLVALLVATAEMPLAALAFSGAAGLAVAFFLGLGRAVAWIAARAGGAGGPVLRLAVANLHRPGAMTRPVVMALGLSLTLLVAVKTIEGNAARHLMATLPASAPGLIFINVPPGEGAAFVERLARRDGVIRVEQAPFLHARLTHVDGVPVHRRRVPADLAWVVRGDRGLSWSDAPPGDGSLVEGEWWSGDHGPEILASIDVKVARGLGVGIGGRIALNLSGRRIEARVANLRKVDWTGIGLDFPILLSRPDPLPDHSVVAAVWTREGMDLAPLENAVLAEFPQSPPIRVAPVLASFAGMAEGLATVLSLMSGGTVAAALVVLAGGVAAGYRRRVREMVLLKVVGARPRQLAMAAALEFVLLGAAAAGLAALLGSAAAFGVVHQLMPGNWRPEPGAVVFLVLATVGAMAATGVLVVHRGLGKPPARLLRQRYPVG